MTTPTFKVGDIVRRRQGALVSSYRVGINSFTVTQVDHNGVTDNYGQWHMKGNLEPAFPATEPTPSPDEYVDPRHEALIRANDSLQAVLRRRNEQIKELKEKLAEAEDEIVVRDLSADSLDTEARRLGLTADAARQALEVGARALAYSITSADFTYLHNLKLRLAAAEPEGATA